MNKGPATLQKTYTVNCSLGLLQRDLQLPNCVGGKKNNHIIQELDIGSELTLIPTDPKCHCGSPVRVGVYRGQIVNVFLVSVPLTVDSVDP